MNAGQKEKEILKSVNSIEDVIRVQSQFYSINRIRRESHEDAEKFITGNMAFIFSVIGVELNDHQVRDVIDEIGKVYWLTIADFKLFLDTLKKHKFYRKDYQEVLQLFWKYVDDRLETAGYLYRNGVS